MSPCVIDVYQTPFPMAPHCQVESCLALMSYSSIMRFTHEKAVVGTDLGLMTTEGAMSGVPAGTFGRTSHMDVQVKGFRGVGGSWTCVLRMKDIDTTFGVWRGAAWAPNWNREAGRGERVRVCVFEVRTRDLNILQATHRQIDIRGRKGS